MATSVNASYMICRVSREVKTRSAEHIYIHVHRTRVRPKSGSLARNCGLRIISAVNSLTFGLRAYQVWYYGSFSRPLPGARGRRIPEGLKGAITPSFVVREKGEHKRGRGGTERPVNAPSRTNFRVFGDPRLSRKPNERHEESRYTRT